MTGETLTDEDFASKAKDIATSLCGDVPQVTRLRSNSNHVFLLDFSGSPYSKIIKMGQQHSEEMLRREQQVMIALHKHGFEVPAIEFTQDDGDFDLPFAIMPFVTGVPIEQVTGLGLSAAGNVYERLGNFMRRLSDSEVSSILGNHLAAEVKRNAEEEWAEGYALLSSHRRCTPRLAEIYENGYSLRLCSDGLQSLIHGDGLQLVANGIDTFSVIDWEAASAGHPLFEIAYFLMGHGFWASLQRQKGVPVYPEWRSPLLAGFAGASGLTTHQATELHVLGASSCIDDALAMSVLGHSKADDFFSFIEEEDAAFLAGSRAER